MDNKPGFEDQIYEIIDKIFDRAIALIKGVLLLFLWLVAMIFGIILVIGIPLCILKFLFGI